MKGKKGKKNLRSKRTPVDIISIKQVNIIGRWIAIKFENMNDIKILSMCISLQWGCMEQLTHGKVQTTMLSTVFLSVESLIMFGRVVNNSVIRSKRTNVWSNGSKYFFSKSDIKISKEKTMKKGYPGPQTNKIHVYFARNFYFCDEIELGRTEVSY